MSNPLFNSNDYNRGFNEGKEDGYNKRDKKYLKMGQSWKFALHGNKALDTYIQGYNEGYLTGQKIESEREYPTPIFQSNLVENKQINELKINNKINLMQRGIDGQIDLLQQMRSYLQQLQDQFDAINKTYQHFLNGLDSEGIDVKLLQRFEDYFEENKDILNNLSSKISSDDIPYTEQVIRHLEDTPR